VPWCGGAISLPLHPEHWGMRGGFLMSVIRMAWHAILVIMLLALPFLPSIASRMGELTVGDLLWG